MSISANICIQFINENAPVMASFSKRAHSRITEVVCTPGEQETLRASSAVPPEQQRLVFGPCSPVVVPCGGEDPVFAHLQDTQAIIFQDSRALGCLVKPRVLVDSPGELAPVSRVSLIYDYWQPTCVDRKQGQLQHLVIPLDSRYCSTSVFSIRAILTTRPGGNVPLPGHHEWSGSKTAAAVNQHQQRLDYIRTQQRLFTEGEGKDSPNRHLLARSDAEYTIDTGPEWEASSLSLTFNTAAELPWLQRIILRLLVIPKAPVDDNGGPIGDTCAEVTVSSSSAGTEGLVAMASASSQPVPQGPPGKHQAGGDAKQPAEGQLQQPAQQEQAVSSSAPGVDPSVSGAGECFGVAATPGVASEAEAGFSSPAISLANSGGATDSCRSGGGRQSTRSAGGGGEPQGSSDSEDDDTARGQSGSGQGRGAAGGGAGGGRGGGRGGGDGGDPGRDRERGQEPVSASPKNARKQKQGRDSEATTDTETNGTTGSTPSSVPGSSSHSDRDAAASLQEASSRSTTMDTADASSDAADEQQIGVTESKPTVKLIPNGPECTLGCEGSPEVAAATSGLAGDSVLASRTRHPCSAGGGGDRASVGGSAARFSTGVDAPICTSGCCKGEGPTAAAGGADAGKVASSVGEAAAPAAAGRPAEEDGGGGESVGGVSSARKFPTATASECAVAADATAALASAAEVTAPAPAKVSVKGPVGDLGAACNGTRDAVSAPQVAPLQPLSPLAPLPTQPLPSQQRPHPNGAAMWTQQPHLKGSPASVHAAEAQQHAMSAAGAAGAVHLPHLPHMPHYGVHGHPLQNGKVRNGEMPGDPAMWPQQLVPTLAAFGTVPGQGAGHSSGSGSGTPSPMPVQPAHHPQAAGQAHGFSNGMDAVLLQQLLMAQPNGALHLQQQGMPVGQHLAHGLGVYGFMYQQPPAPAQHHQQQQQQQQQQLLQQAQMLQQQILQVAVQQAAVQQQQQHQQAAAAAVQQAAAAAAAVQQHQQQQLFMQGLTHVHLPPGDVQYVAAASPAEPAALPSSRAGSSTQLAASPAAHNALAQAAVEASEAQIQQQQQLSQGASASSSSVQPLNPAPINAPLPTVQHSQGSGALGDSAGPGAWESGSAPSVRSEPSTAVAAPLVERPMGPQHRVQSQGNMLNAGQHGTGSSGAMASREAGAGGGGRPSSYRGRTSYSGAGGPAAGHGGGVAGGGGTGSGGPSTGAQPSVMMQGSGSAYGGRPYTGPGGGARHGGGGGGGHGYRGGRYDGGSAEGSRPSSRGPNPHGGGGGGGGGGGHMRHLHSADPVPPPDALPLPDPKGSCDLDRFISQIEPVITIDPAKPPQQALQELRLRDLWNFYFEPSLYGREVFTLGGHRGASNSYFVPYLSAIQIFTRALPTDVGGTNRLYVSEDNQGWPKHMHLKFEYFEQELPFNRAPLYDQIELLSNMMAAGKMGGSGSGPSAGPPGQGPAAGRPAAAPVVAGATATGSAAVPAQAPAAAPSPAAASAAAAPAHEAAPCTAKEAEGVDAAAAAAGVEGVDAVARTSASGEAGNAAGAGGDGGGDGNASEQARPVQDGQKAGGCVAGVSASGDDAQEATAAVDAGKADSVQADAPAAHADTPSSTASASASAAPPSPLRAAQAAPAAAAAPTPAAAPEPEASAAAGSTSNAGSGLLYDMRLMDVHPASWFAVAWYPVYRIPDAPLYARFLTFHSFAPLVESMRNLHERLAMGQVAPYYILSLPVVGLNWYNMQGERWMEPLDESTVARAFNSGGPPPPVAASAPAASVNSPRGPHHRGGGGGGRMSGTDVWYQQLLQNYQSTADRLARGLGLKVLGQHGAEEVRLRVPDYEFFRARS